jgi:hypothetical protein
MRTIWTLLKIIIVIAIAIPLAMFVLATAFGVLGALLGLAFLALKLAIVALLVVGGFKLLKRIFGGKRAPEPPVARALPPVDPHYAAAMRELDLELGESTRH